MADENKKEKITDIEASRKNYENFYEKGESSYPGNEDMVIGCLQRIALSMEKQAENNRIISDAYGSLQRLKHQTDKENRSLKRQLKKLLNNKI